MISFRTVPIQCQVKYSLTPKNIGAQGNGKPRSKLVQAFADLGSPRTSRLCLRARLGLVPASAARCLPFGQRWRVERAPRLPPYGTRFISLTPSRRQLQIGLHSPAGRMPALRPLVTRPAESPEPRTDRLSSGSALAIAKRGIQAKGHGARRCHLSERDAHDANDLLNRQPNDQQDRSLRVKFQPRTRLRKVFENGALTLQRQRSGAIATIRSACVDCRCAATVQLMRHDAPGRYRQGECPTASSKRPSTKNGRGITPRPLVFR